jgi:hypothetical protein
METQFTDRYTSFPDLDHGQEGVPHVATTCWNVDGVQFSTDILVLSWGFILQGFTGELNPVFSLDGEPVKADVSSRTFQKIQADTLLPERGKYTGIFAFDARTAIRL